MARLARKLSSTSTYHIILRGVNRQPIFNSRNDYRHFLSILEFYKHTCNYEIYSYCLMTNHVHLLIHFNENNLSSTMKKIEDKYVWWFNNNYNRCGHLFQERFKSEPIESEDYLLTVFRYIIQNPLKAGIEDTIGSYPWTSYLEYETQVSTITNTQFLSSFFSDDLSLLEFLNQNNNDYCLEYESIKKNDDLAFSLILKTSNCDNKSQFQELPPTKQRFYVNIFLKQGMSMAQICRLTGISRQTITC